MRESRTRHVLRSARTLMAEDPDTSPPPPPLSPWQNTWRSGLAALVGYGTWAASGLGSASGLGGADDHSTDRWALLALDALVGVVAIWIVQRRREHPVPVALGLAALSAAFLSATGAALLAIASLAARRHLRGLAIAVPLLIAAQMVVEVIWPPDEPLAPWQNVAAVALATIAFVAVAYAIGTNRALVQSLREHAFATEREQTARVAQARAAERTRIAREMHDVLAHRISLVAMHAGALTYREDLSDEDRRTAAATIERNARDALTELREILGVLRDTAAVGAATPPPEAPQPTLRDVPSLIAETRTLGAGVELTDDSGEVPERVARTAYRIIQEALTNARKHAPGAPVAVALAGGDGSDLLITVIQEHPSHRGAVTPGAGLGLLGLRERVALHGGTLEAGPDADGHWVVRARIPLQS